MSDSSLDIDFDTDEFEDDILLPQKPSFLLEWWQSIDRLALGLFLALLAIGMILSMATSPVAAARIDRDAPFYFFIRHLIFVFMGLGGALFVSCLSPQNARRIGVLALLGSILALFLVSTHGFTVKGATRWLRIGPIGLQPSEIIKPAFIVFAAWMFTATRRDPRIAGKLIVFAVYGLILFFLIRQPDMGQSFLLTVCFAAVFFFAGLPLGWMLFFFAFTTIGGLGAYFSVPHFRDRIKRFSSNDSGDTYQTDRSLEAISNGGFLGQGPGEGVFLHRVPDVNTDFVFAAVVEEFGFLISAVIVLTLGALIYRAFRQALRLNDAFCQLAVAGLATMIGVQMLINLAVNLNMAPPKGMTLPFISNGGSSMLALCFTVGLILAFTRRRPGAYAYGV